MTDFHCSWPMAELGRIAQFRNGLNYSKENFGKGLKVINVGDFGDRSTPDYESLDEICPDGIIREESLLGENDILFVRSNGNRELIGRSMMLRAKPSFPLSHSAFTIRARFNSDSAFPRFFSYVFRSQLIRSVLSAHGNGANISNLNQDILSRLLVPLPDLHTQHRIASILSAYDDLIENNTRRIAILEEMARRIYEEWFVHFRFPGHEQVPMVESELGLIPEGWKVVPLREASEINAHSIRPANAPEEILYIDIASVAPGSITDKQQYKFSDAPGRARRVVRHGDVIWSCVRPNRRSYALVLQPEPALIASTGFAVLSAKTVPYSYLYFAVTSDDFVSFLTNHATGAAYPAVTASTFESAPFLAPETEIADRFHSVVEPMLNLSETLKRKNANLRTTRDLLLPKLISGELDVSTLSEPA